MFTIWVFYAFFIEENGSNTNVAQRKGVFSRVVHVSMGVLRLRKQALQTNGNTTVWLMFMQDVLQHI